MKSFFTKDNLEQLRNELGLDQMTYDQRIDEFLVHIGNEFIQQSLTMTI